MRQVGNNTAVAIATNVYSFDPHDISTNVTCSVTFAPNFTRSSGSHTWWDGNGPPSSVLGVDGDYYMDDSTNTMYLKSKGAYAPDANTVYCNLSLRNPRARQ